MSRRSLFLSALIIGLLLLLPSSKSTAGSRKLSGISHLPRHIPDALSGSFVAFDPTPGGDACYMPDDQQTFCFKAETFSQEPGDIHYVYDLSMRFPTDWHVENVFIQGNPSCVTGANWGGFSWSYIISPYEVNISHPRNMSPVDDCTAYYCFNVWTGSDSGDALESWNYNGESPQPPDDICSSDGYRGSNTECDEAEQPLAAIPVCSWEEGTPSPEAYTSWDCTWFDDGSGPSDSNQKVYCMGGSTGEGIEDPSIWKFDPVINAWNDTGLDMPEDVSDYDANVLYDGSSDKGPAIYVVGGMDVDNLNLPTTAVQRFYPKTGEVEVVDTDPWPGSLIEDVVLPGGCVSALNQTKLYCFGGVETNQPPYNSNITYEYDPARPDGSRWMELTGADLAYPRGYMMASVFEDIIYAIGGEAWNGTDFLPLAEVEYLDLNQLSSGWQLGGDLPYPSSHGRSFDVEPAAFFGDPLAERIFIAGGGEPPDVSAEAMSFIINAGMWRQGFPDLVTARSDHAGVYVPLCTLNLSDGLPGLWVFGGSNGSGSPLNGTEFYPMQCRQPIIYVSAPILEPTMLPDNLTRIPVGICNGGNETLSFSITEITGTLPLVKAGTDLVDPPPPGSVVIDFDDAAQHCAFNEVYAVRDEYASQGVLFSGPAPQAGGAILGDCYGYGVTGYSSPNYLAFDQSETLADGGTPYGPETITFLGGADYVQINIGTEGSEFGVMVAYDAGGNYLASDNLVVEPGMQTLSIAARGISYVVIDFSAFSYDNYVLDDLAYLPMVDNNIPWLNEKPVAGVLPITQCGEVNVYFDTTGLSEGIYTGTLGVLSNDPASPQINLPVTLTVAAPELEVTPLSIDETVHINGSVDVPVEVCNSGTAPLDISFVEVISGTRGWNGNPATSLVGVFKDADPYGVTDLEEFLAAQGIPFEIHPSTDFGTLDFHRFSMIVFSGDQTQDFYDAYAFYYQKFVNYVEDGGFLNFIAHDAGNNGGYLHAALPGGVTYANSWFEFANIIDDINHPVVAGVPNPFSGDWASSGMLDNLPDGYHLIAHGMDMGGNTIVEYPLGKGWVIAFTQAVEFSHFLHWEGGPIMENALLYGSAYTPAEVPWLSASPVIETIPPGECRLVTVNLDAQGLSQGVYTAALELNSNDPDEQELVLNVSLNVQLLELFLPVVNK